MSERGFTPQDAENISNLFPQSEVDDFSIKMSRLFQLYEARKYQDENGLDGDGRTILTKIAIRVLEKDLGKDFSAQLPDAKGADHQLKEDSFNSHLFKADAQENDTSHSNAARIIFRDRQGAEMAKRAQQILDL